MHSIRQPEIRQAQLSDLASLATVYDEYRQLFSLPSSKQRCVAFLRERLVKQDSIIWIAVINDTVVGFIQIYPSFSSIAMRPIWQFNDLFIGTQFRRKNIATQLIQSMEVAAQQNNIFSIKLATATTNQAAQQLYKKLNYQPSSDFLHFFKQVPSKSEA
ncbi:N-acetyltransferase family protein [Aliikangiella sp. IMCC44653]